MLQPPELDTGTVGINISSMRQSVVRRLVRGHPKLASQADPLAAASSCYCRQFHELAGIQLKQQFQPIHFPPI